MRRDPVIQVNFTAAPPAGAEMPATPSERSEDTEKGGFLAHMDALMNNRAPSESDREEAPQDKDSAKAETDPLTMMMGASLIPAPQERSASMPPADFPIAGEAKTAVPEGCVDPSEKTFGTMQAPIVPPETTEPGVIFNAKEMEQSENKEDLLVQQITNSNAALPVDRAPVAETLKAVETKATGIKQLFNRDAVDTGQKSDETKQAGNEIPRNETRQTELSPAANAADIVQSSEDAVKPVTSDKAATSGKMENAMRMALEKAVSNDSHAARQDAQSESSTPRQFPPNRSETTPVVVRSESSASAGHNVPNMVATPASITVNDPRLVPAAPRAQTASPQSSEFMLQLADRMQVLVRDGRGEIRVQLHPENLGHLEIRAENASGGVIARIVAESSTVKNYLESNLHLLQQSIQDQGLKIDRIQVTVQDNGGSESFAGHTAQSGYPGSGSQERRNGRSTENPGSLESEEPGLDAVTMAMMNPNARFYTVA